MAEIENQAHTLPPARDVQALPRRPYQKPELVEWGSLIELTQGGFSGLQDLPAGGDGGSEPE
jgi:hypothetical protein